MLVFQGRTRELGWLRSLLDRPESVLIRVEGPPGIGKTALLRRATADYETHHHVVPPLPDSAQRATLAAELGMEPDAAADWIDLLARAAELPVGSTRPRVLVLDDAHRLADARARLLEPLAARLAAPGTASPPCHVVLVGRSLDALFERRPSGAPVEHALELRPLPLRAAAPLLPGGGAVERIVSYAVFGGVPARLGLLDRTASLATNVRRLVLQEGAPLADDGVRTLERELQTPSRYAAVLAALSAGEADWAAIHDGVPDVQRGGQVAPYLRRLERMGLVEVRRSLDAREGSRNRRYRIVDPFDAFWFRCVLPRARAIELGSGPDAWPDLRTPIAEHVASVFPDVCRQYMALDASERFPANARECGSLWGSGYDLPVAGLLGSGAAFYGLADWSGELSSSTLDRLDRQIKETRYGFGREQRLRVLFAPGPFPTELERRVARRHDTLLVDAEALDG